MFWKTLLLFQSTQTQYFILRDFFAAENLDGCDPRDDPDFLGFDFFVRKVGLLVSCPCILTSASTTALELRGSFESELRFETLILIISSNFCSSASFCSICFRSSALTRSNSAAALFGIPKRCWGLANSDRSRPPAKHDSNAPLDVSI